MGAYPPCSNKFSDGASPATIVSGSGAADSHQSSMSSQPALDLSPRKYKRKKTGGDQTAFTASFAPQPHHQRARRKLPDARLSTSAFLCVHRECNQRQPKVIPPCCAPKPTRAHPMRREQQFGVTVVMAGAVRPPSWAESGKALRIVVENGRSMQAFLMDNPQFSTCLDVLPRCVTPFPPGYRP